MNEIIKSAIDRIKLKGEEIWVRYSFWTKAKDVELESGENVENKLTSVDATLSNHVSDKSNPHETTKKQVGLSYVDNTSDVEKPVSTHQREAIDASYQQSTSYTDTKIAELINGAPTTLDTLKEIADAMTNNQTVVEALEASIGSKADQAELDGHINNGTIHITADERAKWNNQSDCSEIIGYTNINGIGDGTLTGAISSLNDNKVTTGSQAKLYNVGLGNSDTALIYSDKDNVNFRFKGKNGNTQYANIKKITGDIDDLSNNIDDLGKYTELGRYYSAVGNEAGTISADLSAYRYLVFNFLYAEEILDSKILPRKLFTDYCSAYPIKLTFGSYQAQVRYNSGIYAFVNAAHYVVVVYGIK